MYGRYNSPGRATESANVGRAALGTLRRDVWPTSAGRDRVNQRQRRAGCVDDLVIVARFVRQCNEYDKIVYCVIWRYNAVFRFQSNICFNNVVLTMLYTIQHCPALRAPLGGDQPCKPAPDVGDVGQPLPRQCPYLRPYRVELCKPVSIPGQRWGRRPALLPLANHGPGVARQCWGRWPTSAAPDP